MNQRCGEDCAARHCSVCRHNHLEASEPATCVRCLGRARGDLAALVDAYALLPEQLVAAGRTSFEPIPRGKPAAAMPGGDVLVLLAGGNVGGGDPTVEQPDDPQPPLPVLAAWEDDFRRLRGQPAAGKATMVDVVAYLNRELSWAAQHHPGFPDFAGDVRQLRRGLEAATSAGEPLDRGGRIGCPECGEGLVRHYAEPKPCTHEARPCGCDQGGRADDWTCPNRGCGRIVDDREYNFAVWAALEGEAQ